MVAERLPLITNIGTSSSYCMPAFGNRLGRQAVGLFASDKLDGEYVNKAGLTASGRALLHQARSAYEDRFDAEMSAAALVGVLRGLGALPLGHARGGRHHTELGRRGCDGDALARRGASRTAAASRSPRPAARARARTSAR